MEIANPEMEEDGASDGVDKLLVEFMISIIDKTSKLFLNKFMIGGSMRDVSLSANLPLNDDVIALVA